MRNLGSYTKTILKLVKEQIVGNSLPYPTAVGGGAAAPTFNPIQPPYVTVGDQSVFVFVYGVSEYGGDDIIVASENPRQAKRYFLTLSGD